MKSLFFISTLLMIACGQKKSVEKMTNPTASISPFSGVWVESTNRSDTLDFERLAPTAVVLKRGFEEVDGRKKTKRRHGFHWYKVEGDSINLQWCFASVTDSTNYFFHLKNDTLVISNFYDEGRSEENEIFVRIEK